MFFSRRRGFSLIEAAIVLGIVGLVIGGLWVAVSAVQSQRRVNGIKEAIAFARSRGLQLKPAVAGAAPYYAYLQAPILGRSIPGGFVWDAPNVSFYRNENTYLWFILDVTPASEGAYFETVIFLNAPDFFTQHPKPDLCIKLSEWLLSLNLGKAQTLGGYSIAWAGDPTFIATWKTGETKPSLSTVSTYCETAISLYVKWAI